MLVDKLKNKMYADVLKNKENNNLEEDIRKDVDQYFLCAR